MNTLTFDTVSHPKHYQLFEGVEVRHLIQNRLTNAALNGYPMDKIGYDLSNAIKYLMRWAGKNGVEDLKKAKQCIEFMLEELGE